jgi:hypothetical protein
MMRCPEPKLWPRILLSLIRPIRRELRARHRLGLRERRSACVMVFGRRPITDRATRSGPAFENRQRTKPREREGERRRALPSYGDLRIAPGVMNLVRTRRGRELHSGDGDKAAWSRVFERRSEWCGERDGKLLWRPSERGRAPAWADGMLRRNCRVIDVMRCRA